MGSSSVTFRVVKRVSQPLSEADVGLYRIKGLTYCSLYDPDTGIGSAIPVLVECSYNPSPSLSQNNNNSNNKDWNREWWCRQRQYWQTGIYPLQSPFPSAICNLTPEQIKIERQYTARLARRWRKEREKARKAPRPKSLLDTLRELTEKERQRKLSRKEQERLNRLKEELSCHHVFLEKFGIHLYPQQVSEI